MRCNRETEEESQTSETISSPINPIRYPLRAHFFGYAESHLVSIKRRDSRFFCYYSFARRDFELRSAGRKLYISSFLSTRRFHPCLKGASSDIFLSTF
jgi:hypothetical protein